MKTALLQRSGMREAALLIASVMVAATMMFSISAPQAHAAGLTEPQIQAILNLLVAFDVPQATITNVSNILHKSSTPVSSGSHY